MSQGLLILNAGSSSIKFSVFAIAANDELALVCSGLQESLGETNPHFKALDHSGKVLIDLHLSARAAHPEAMPGTVYDHQAALRDLLAWLQKTPGLPEVVAVGHRVVHGAQEYSDPQLLTPAIIERLAHFIPLAPLHQPHNLSGIHALQAVRPDLPQVGCFDTAFHYDQPQLAQVFAIPQQYRDEGVRRYGFHGLSYEFIAGRLADLLGTQRTGRVVVAHLGNGASMCAMRDGQSIASTMGFTAIDGLPMGTRTGSIDPGVLLYLMGKHDMGVKELTHFLYKKSGLLGLSGVSNDMRTLLASDDANAKLAVDYFCYRIARELGSLAAALNGLDALVFTGGIGEHAAAVRAQVCAQSTWLGISMDAEANARHAQRIDQMCSKIPVWVLPTDEELVIARHTKRLVLGD